MYSLEKRHLSLYNIAIGGDILKISQEINRADMIFDLSSIWSAVKEVFPYFDQLYFDWNSQYLAYLEQLLQVTEEQEFHHLLSEFLDSLHDGHTKYIPPAEYRDAKPYAPPDKPSFTFDDGIINEFLRNHAPYVKELLESNPDIRLVRLDVRNNIGGNTSHAAKVAELFIPGEFPSCQKWTQAHNAVETAGASQIARYSQERMQQYIQDGLMTKEAFENAKNIINHTKYEEYTSFHGKKNQSAIYEGPLEILISHNTISAAEDFVAMFKSNHRGTLIGEATYGSTGTPCMIPLRCGGRAQVVSVGYRLADGTEFIGRGIMPDIERT